MKLTFTSPKALDIFHSMAEGMCEVAEDNSHEEPSEKIRATDLDRLIMATSPPYPYTVELPHDLALLASSVLENLDDPANIANIEDPDQLHPGMIVVEPSD